MNTNSPTVDIAALNAPVGTLSTISFADESYFYAEPQFHEEDDDNEFLYIETTEGLYLPQAHGSFQLDEHTDIEEGLGGPMSDSFWVLEEDREGYVDREEIIGYAAKLASLNVAVVRVGNQVGLALTGAGMNLSWQMAAAHIRIGYLPPSELHLADLRYGIQMLGEEEALAVAEARLADLERRQRFLANEYEDLYSQVHRAESK